MADAVSTLGLQIEVVRASDAQGIEAAFTTLVRNKTDALVVGADPFFFFRRIQFATLATRHAIPAVYTVREYPQAGCLIELRHKPPRSVSAARHLHRSDP